MTQPNSNFDVPSDEFRKLGHAVVELMIDALEAERREPVLRHASGEELRSLFDEPLPEHGVALGQVVAAWGEDMLRYSRRNGHAGFLAYVCPSADPIGMLADAMASAMNQTVTSWRSAPVATEIERLVLRWLDTMVGFGADGSGVMVSGGSAANFHGLACAVAEAEHQADLAPGSRHRLTVYMSSEAHVSMRKAGRTLGLPLDNVRLLGIDEQRRLSPDQVRAAIARDRADGLVPAAVCASAGTANTGAIDPLDDIADICDEHDVWFHVDGSYGAPAVMSDRYGWMGPAFGRAASMSLDPHKWLFAPGDAGSVLIRDRNAARRAFSDYSEYTAVSQTAPIERYAFFDESLEMSRRFRALKVWSILKARGAGGIRAAIDHNIDLRRRLDDRVAAHPRLEHLGGDLSISCFRYVPDGLTPLERVNDVNRHILETLVREGRFYMSPTVLEERYALRVCIVNFRTTANDIDLLVDEVLRLGES